MSKRYSNTISILNSPFFEQLKFPPKRLKTEGEDHSYKTSLFSKTNIKKQKFRTFLRDCESGSKMKVERMVFPCTNRLQQGKVLFKNLTSRERKKILAKSKENAVQICKNEIKLYSPDKAMVKFRKKIKEIKQLSRRAIQTDAEKQIVKERFQVFWESLKGTRHNENQDAVKFSEGLYIICDGHGSNGKDVACFVSHNLHEKLSKTMEEGKVNKNTIEEAFTKTEFDLEVSGLDIAFSGCTCLSIILKGDQIFCANVGDSKAFLRHGYKDQLLSFQHKPDRSLEKKRIQTCGGVIKQLQVSKDKFVGPLRIWAPGKNSWGPGLALSRAFGDKAAKKLGLISEPQISEFEITENTEFIVMGSDGLFDQLSMEEIVASIRKYSRDDNMSKEEICCKLAMEAKTKWEEESDDISIILIFL